MSHETLTVERKLEPQKPTAAFIGASWAALLLGVTCYLIGLWNANLLLSEKGFYGISMALSIFAVIAVQKNVRDLEAFKEADEIEHRQQAEEWDPANRQL